jgi:hypothetical protein
LLFFSLFCCFRTLIPMGMLTSLLVEGMENLYSFQI